MQFRRDLVIGRLAVSAKSTWDSINAHHFSNIKLMRVITCNNQQDLRGSKKGYSNEKSRTRLRPYTYVSDGSIPLNVTYDRNYYTIHFLKVTHKAITSSRHFA